MRIPYALDAILFYSKGEQEAQSATLARSILNKELFKEIASDNEIQQAWCVLFQFLARDFRTILKWERNSAEEFFAELDTSVEDGLFWTRLLRGCLQVANSLVWGLRNSIDQHFDEAVAQAKSWGETRLVWLALTVKEIAEIMLNRSLRKRLTEMGVPGWASEALTMDSLVEMWLPHREAFRQSAQVAQGILSKQARVSLINMPTSAGKSLVAEIAIIFELTMTPESKAIWIVPSRALIFEVQSRLNTHLRRIGIKVSSMPGGLEAEPDDMPTLESARVFVLTPERLDGLLRRNPNLMESVRIVVVDEMQKIGDGSRGWLFETVIAWLLLIAEEKEDLRLIFMSALLPNRVDFEVWLNEQGHGFLSKWATWRPTRLALFVTSGSDSKPWTTRLVQKHSQEVIAIHKKLRWPRMYYTQLFLLQILYDEMKQTGSTLVFFYTKDDVNAFVGRLAQVVSKREPVPEMYQALSAKFAAVYGDSHPFTKALERGVGVDHADIPLWLRHLVERAFRNSELPILVANQTILEGVNFPIDFLIIGSLGSGQSGGFHFRLGALEYNNLVGRVGRAMVDTEGLCFLAWNWFYQDKADGNLSWEIYSAPDPPMEDISSTLATNEKQLMSALQRLTLSLEGTDEAAFEAIGFPWRDRLERLHSCALAILELYGSVDYSRLSRWIQKSLAWQQLGSEAKGALNHYVTYAWKGFQEANRPLYRLASASGLTVHSAREILSAATSLIENWDESKEPSFKTVFTEESFGSIMDLRECWRRRPVTYPPWSTVPKIDHYASTMAWINGDDWTQVADTICAEVLHLHEKTRSGIVAAYVSQIFEYRLPWVLGAVALAVKELGGPNTLCQFLEELPSYVRYGVNMKEAVTISKLCGAERTVAIKLAQKFLEQIRQDGNLLTWLQHLSLDDLRQWLPSEPGPLLIDLHKGIRSVRNRDWTLRREGTVVVELAGWHAYAWREVAEALRAKIPVTFSLRPEPSNAYDPFAVAVDAFLNTSNAHIGYVPAIHSEEVSELLDWGRKIEVIIKATSSTTSPQMKLVLLPVR